MNCDRCHHTDEAHMPSDESTSLMKLGKCQIPNCTCNQYREGIEQIDEDLL